jgi:predicted metal-dependent hydrolase
MREFLKVPYGSHTILVEIVRRRRSTLEIAVEPDTRVVATAPLDASQEKIAEKIRKRATWVLRQQRFFTQYLPRTPRRKYVPGETHLYLGRAYRLRIRSHKEDTVRLVRGFLIVHSRRSKQPQAIRGLVAAWYRERARARFNDRLENCLTRFGDAEAFRPRAMIVRQMYRRWGSMSLSGRLMLNSRLVEAPVDAIDYVITHELCHRAQPHHGPRFFKLLEQVMPDWERRKARLERILA